MKIKTYSGCCLIEYDICISRKVNIKKGYIGYTYPHRSVFRCRHLPAVAVVRHDGADYEAPLQRGTREQSAVLDAPTRARLPRPDRPHAGDHGQGPQGRRPPELSRSWSPIPSLHGA